MRDGYCEHGTYVGGCGIDWMCPYCEDGISVAELRKNRRREEWYARRRRLMVKLSYVLLALYLRIPIEARNNALWVKIPRNFVVWFYLKYYDPNTIGRI